MSAKNKEFYENFPVGKLNGEYALNAGLSNAYELEHPIIKNFVNKLKTILEIGSGEGRIIQWLIDQGYDGKIFAVERSKPFLDYLRKEYSQYNNIEILEKDIINDSLPGVDLGLFLWSGILEFDEKDQKILVEKLSENCKKLVIDTPCQYFSQYNRG